LPGALPFDGVEEDDDEDPFMGVATGTAALEEDAAAEVVAAGAAALPLELTWTPLPAFDEGGADAPLASVGAGVALLAAVITDEASAGEMVLVEVVVELPLLEPPLPLRRS
jgi:hypothetical protein